MLEISEANADGNDRGVKPPPEDQGFLSNVNRGRVSRKARPKGVIDGKQVNIPARLVIAMGDGEG